LAKKQDQAKVVAIVSYITFIGWIVALILNSNNKTALGSFHLRQSLMIMLAGLVLSWIPYIGWFFGLAMFIFWVMGLVYAINSQQKEVPLIGQYAQKWFKGL